MKTYAESKNKLPFNWNLFLKNARKGRTTEIEEENALSLAGTWVTCACGNQCDAIPRTMTGMPLDSTLIRLGADFTCYIQDKEWEYATEILSNIEARSSELLIAMEQPQI